MDIQTIINVLISTPDDILSDEIEQNDFIKNFIMTKRRLYKIIKQLKIRKPDEYKDLIEFVLDIEEKNMVGDIIEIDADPDVYKNMILTAKNECWIFNGINVVKNDDKWLVFFY